VRHERLRVVQGDVLQADTVLRAMQRQQAVICALGPAAGAVPGTVISEGAHNLIHAMAQTGVCRIVFEPGIIVGEGLGLGVWQRLRFRLRKSLNLFIIRL